MSVVLKRLRAAAPFGAVSCQPAPRCIILQRTAPECCCSQGARVGREHLGHYADQHSERKARKAPWLSQIHHLSQNPHWILSISARVLLLMRRPQTPMLRMNGDFRPRSLRRRERARYVGVFFLCIVTRLKLRGGVWSSGDERGAILDLGAFPDEPATRLWHWKVSWDNRAGPWA